jgi:hypothetical protein
MKAPESTSIAFSGEVDFRFAAENASNATKAERFSDSNRMETALTASHAPGF